MNYSKLQKAIGYTFKEQKLLEEALTHKSSKKTFNNERLEFLGDAVLGLGVAEYLYSKFTNAKEGELSKIRASIVNEAGLSMIAKMLDIGSVLSLSAAEEKNGGRQKASILADAFEAILGAIYLESGLEIAKKVALEQIEKVFPIIDFDTLFKDYKTTLQEITQAKFGVTPEYLLVSSSGPDHQKEFEMCVNINGKRYAEASGKNKKDAEQSCAKLAIEKLKADNE
jgi:ribonuclease-3